MRNHIVDGITELAKADDRIMIITADLGFSVLEKFAELFPNRYINCGISEQNMASVAAGLALEGNMVFMYSIGNFPTLRCIEQVRNNICYHEANVKILAVGGGFSYGTLGMTHHATEDLAMMRALPKMQVYAPADPIEVKAVLQKIYRTDAPCYVRLARGSDPVLHNEHDIGDIFSPIQLQKGDHIAILTTGTILSEGIAATRRLKEEGFSVSLYSVPTLRPFDAEAIQKIASRHEWIFTVEEHGIVGGLFSAVAEALSQFSCTTRIYPFGLRNTFTNIVGDQKYLRQHFEMDSDAISKKAEDILRGGNR